MLDRVNRVLCHTSAPPHRVCWMGTWAMMANHATATRPRRRQNDEVHGAQYAPDVPHDAAIVVQVPYPCTVVAAAASRTVNHAEAARTGQSRCQAVQDLTRASHG